MQRRAMAALPEDLEAGLGLFGRIMSQFDALIAPLVDRDDIDATDGDIGDSDPTAEVEPPRTAADAAADMSAGAGAGAGASAGSGVIGDPTPAPAAETTEVADTDAASSSEADGIGAHAATDPAGGEGGDEAPAAPSASPASEPKSTVSLSAADVSASAPPPHLHYEPRPPSAPKPAATTSAIRRLTS